MFRKIPLTSKLSLTLAFLYFHFNLFTFKKGSATKLIKLYTLNMYSFLHVSHISYQRRQWHPTPVLLPGKSHGRRSLVGCSPWGLEESDMTVRLHFHFSLSCIGEGNGNPLQCSCVLACPVFLPGESQGWGSLMGCRLWGRTESDTTEAT